MSRWVEDWYTNTRHFAVQVALAPVILWIDIRRERTKYRR